MLLLRPFLAVIRSSSTTGQITSLALNSISKFFSYRLINSDSRNLAEAMKALSSAVTHCRFEASDSGQQDEVVLLRILTLMQEMMSGVGSDLLSDESVCEMMETGLSMCCQMRLSEMLRRSAEMAMSKMVQVVFLHLKDLDPDDNDNGASSLAQAPITSPKLAPMASLVKGNEDIPVDDHKLSNESLSNGTSNDSIVPYGITSIRELLRVLISILNPTQRQHTDSMRVMALRIIEVAFEVGGTAIAQRPSLRRLASDDLCRFLFQLIRSDNHVVLQASLRVICTLLHTMRIHLKLQQELFLNYVVACLVPRPEALRESGIDPAVYEALPVAPRVKQLTSGRSTPVPIKDRQRLGLEGGARGADAREVMIECIGSLVRIPTFMIDLFVNYDCAENLSDLCEDVLGFLCRNAFPDAAIWSTTNVPPLCLDALLGYISLVNSRLGMISDQDLENMPDPAKLSESRYRKELVVKASAKFNEDPKAGVAFLKEYRIIDTSNELESLANFLFTSGRINKRLLGDYISKPKNLELLQSFIKFFDFHGKRLDEALRELLQKFRLPGEAQQIARIVEEFASIYYASGTTEIGNADAAYVLSYAIIMLNTDQHNPQAKKSKMTAVDFAKNLRGTNNNENFRAEYLQDIYDEIKNNEIIMPEEHDTSASFDYAWKELLARMPSAGSLTVCRTNAYDEAMFRSTWKPLVATLTFVFQSATDDAVFSRVIGGLSQCANIAAHYGLTEVIDQIIGSLAKMTLLAAEQIPSIENNTVVEVDKQKVTVSDLGVAFGREFKAQLATVILFRICNGNEKAIRSAWAPIFDIFSSLLVNSMLPASFSPLHRYMKISTIPLPPPIQSTKTVQRNQESSFFNSLSSYLSSYTSDEPSPPTSEEIESTMCTFDCINSCHLEIIAANILSLESDALDALIDYLLSPADQAPSTAAIGTLLAQGTAADQPQLIYDPALLLKLELATALSLTNGEHTMRFGDRVLLRLSDITVHADQNHYLMTERALTYSLRLSQAVLETDDNRDFGMIATLNELDDNVLRATAIPIAYGLLGCLRVESALKRVSENQDVLELLRKLQQHPDVASLLFELVSLLTTVITHQSFFTVVTLLGDFATAGKIGAQDERQALLQRRQSHDKKLKGQQIPPKPSAAHRDEVQRACRAVEILCQLRPETSHLAASSEDPQKYWLAILEILRAQCLSPCKEVAKYSFAHLQRLLLTLDLTSNNPAVSTIFDDTVIPLLQSVQNAPKNKSKAGEDLKVQASSLLCKVWLHHLQTIQADDAADEQWLRVLGALIQLMQADQSPYLAEAVTESLKNVLLVMNSTQMLESGSKSFVESTKVLTEAKLTIMQELFPQSIDVPKPAQDVKHDSSSSHGEHESLLSESSTPRSSSVA